jgi:hypothetical protein
MPADLLSALRGAYTDAYRADDRRAMDVADQAISYATSGNRDLATQLAIELHITVEA